MDRIQGGGPKFPEAYALSSIEDDGRLLGLRWQHRACLHLRLEHLTTHTRAWIAHERERIGREYGAPIGKQRLAA